MCYSILIVRCCVHAGLFFFNLCCICVRDGVQLCALHLLAYTQKQCCKPMKLQKETERVLGGFGSSHGSALARYESPNKAKGSPYEALRSFYEGQAGPGIPPTTDSGFCRVFVLLMLKVSYENRVI